MRSDKKLFIFFFFFFFFCNCMEFLPSTFQRLCLWKIPLHFLEIWSKLYPVWKVTKEGWVRKTQILTNLKRQIAAKLHLLKSWYIFLPTHANCEKSDQFEMRSLQSWATRENIHTPYRYIYETMKTGLFIFSLCVFVCVWLLIRSSCFKYLYRFACSQLKICSIIVVH